MEPIIDYLVEKWPVFIIIVITAVFVWFLSELYHRFIKVEKKMNNLPCEKQEDFYHRIVATEEKVDNLPCSEHSKSLQDNKEELAVVHTTIHAVKEKVDNQPCAEHSKLLQDNREELAVIHAVKEKVDSLPCAEHSKLLQDNREELAVVHATIRAVKEKVDNQPCAEHSKILQDIREELATIRAVKEKVDSLPCSKHEGMFGKIKEELAAIRTALTMENPKLASYLSQKNSPRELSEDGRKLFADIKGEEFLNNNKDILIKGIEERNPKTPLDVEELSLKILLRLVDDDMFIEMKKWVYNSSPRKILIDGVEKSYDITMLDVCFVLSLPLRNMYLDLHKELL